MNPCCVILCPEPLIDRESYPRTKCLFLQACTAERAIQTASDDNPQWRVIGIEPSHVLLPCYGPILRVLYRPMAALLKSASPA